MDTPQEDKVELFSISGETPARNAAHEEDKVSIVEWHSAAGGEKAWTIDRYHLTVGIAIISVFAVMGGIVWLASGGGGNSSGANVLPTGELEFNEKGEVAGTSDYGNLPYPSVRNAMPLAPAKATIPSKSPSKIPTLTPTTKPAETGNPDPTPTPTSKPNDPDPTATSTPAPTATHTPTPTLTPEITPTPTE